VFSNVKFLFGNEVYKGGNYYQTHINIGVTVETHGIVMIQLISDSV